MPGRHHRGGEGVSRWQARPRGARGSHVGVGWGGGSQEAVTWPTSARQTPAEPSVSQE